MALSLSRRTSSMLLKLSSSPCPFSLSANHSMSQILDPTSSAHPYYIFSADCTTLNRFSVPFGVESVQPKFNFLRFFSCVSTEMLSQPIPIESNRNFFKPRSDFPQTPFGGKPKTHSSSSTRSYSIPNITFLRSFESTASFSSEAKSNDPELKPINSSSSTSDGSESTEPESHRQHPEFQHQEIVGPTVERDISALAEETRQVLQNLKKTVYNLGTIVALLGLVQLSCGAWIAYTAKLSPLSAVSIQSFMAFSFPFSLAFLLRQMLKPMHFFEKMEQQGRLQILTLALQVSKCLNLFFLRVRVLSFFCVVGMSMGLLYSTLSGFN